MRFQPYLLLAALAVTACDGAERPNENTNGGVDSGSGAELDTDQDGLTDAEERSFGTSPLMPDTDGDALTDFEEIRGGGFNPLVADVPLMNVEFVGNVDVLLDSALSENCQNTQSTLQATLEAQETSYSQTDARATRTTVEASLEVSTTVSAEAFPPAASASTTATASTSVSNVQERSTSFTSSSASTAQQEYESYAERSCFSGSETSGGTITMGFKISNPSRIAYTLNSISLTVLQRRGADGQFTTLATVEPLTSPVTFTPGLETGTLTVAAEVPARRAMELLENPAGLFFEVGVYDLIDEEERNFAFINQTTLSQTALVLVDYGPNRGSERHLVATNVDRDAQGRPVGVSMARALETLELDYATEPSRRPAGGEGPSILSSLESYSYDQSIRQLWYVFGSAQGIGDSETSFEDISLRAGDVVQLVLIRDSDGDSIIDREELLLRSDPENPDSDGDGLDDFEEARTGWVVATANGTYPVKSDPVARDRDGDGLEDDGERARGTDPYEWDTDGDGISDLEDDLVNGAQPVAIGNVQLRKILDEYTLTGEVVAQAPLATVTVDWGDGEPPYVARPVGASLPMTVAHRYGSGDFSITITAVDSAGNEATRRFELRNEGDRIVSDRLTASDGFETRNNPRLSADVNGDGREDLIAFGDSQVFVGVFDQAGEITVTPWYDGFGTDRGWRVERHSRQVVDVNADGCADIVGFAEYDTYVALSNCQDGFGAAEIWTPEFGAADGYEEARKARFVVDVNNDGLRDIVAMHNDTRVALNTGSGFSSSIFAHAGYRSSHWDAEDRIEIADFDGDGFADVVGLGSSGTWVSLGQGDGTFGAGVRVTTMFSESGGWLASRHPRLLGDVNGDGLPDIVGMANAVTVTVLNESVPGAPAASSTIDAISDFNYYAGWHVLHYEVVRVPGQPSWVQRLAQHRFLRHPRFLSDVSGDGVLDIVAISNSATLMARGRGDGTFEPAVQWSGNFGSNVYREVAEDTFSSLIHDYLPRRLLDWDGDGVADIVGFARDGIVVETTPTFLEVF